MVEGSCRSVDDSSPSSPHFCCKALGRDFLVIHCLPISPGKPFYTHFSAYRQVIPYTFLIRPQASLVSFLRLELFKDAVCVGAAVIRGSEGT